MNADSRSVPVGAGLAGHHPEHAVDKVTFAPRALVRPPQRPTTGNCGGTGRTSTDATAICAAAQQGRVETLFVRTDPPSGTPRIIPPREGSDAVDHRDCAAVTTLRYGGTVYATPRHRIPDTAPMAAVLSAFWLPNVGKE
ncbi:hypothetical protein [Micromonospora wenchangensis]|uniref:hypothetical protein n=1 Tax=Micromonospora wenchangensis TaxID=1185415 RepID=UPI003D753003